MHQLRSEMSWLTLSEPTCLLTLTVSVAQLIPAASERPWMHSMTPSKQRMFIVPLVVKRALEHRAA